MKITLRPINHKGGRFGNEVQVHAIVHRFRNEEPAHTAVMDTICAIIREGAAENGLRVFFKEDMGSDSYSLATDENRGGWVSSKKERIEIAVLKARMKSAENEARIWKRKYDEMRNKFYNKISVG